MNDQQKDKLRQCSTGEKPEIVVAIGGSAGAFQEIVKIVEYMPNWFSGTVIIATHRTPNHKNTLAELLGHKARVAVEEPEDEECLECTTIYIGNSRDRVEVDENAFDVNEDVSFRARLRRIDDLFLSVAASAGCDAVGVILSGMLDDGTRGLKAIADAGGVCMIQCPEQAERDSMPLNALSAVPSARIGITEEIISWLMEMSAERGAL
ncbi:chemotaxis protein CheB [Rhodopirellula bahusiensis]|uniref:chemotaxis protein CheB n=1 Tax=Rhodopirellula bahusiensis TaxID=2014065 RepID=UPI001E4AE599|nr:chemotaxis protein CheB [Rhodopirellula bahusiensis]